MKFYVYEHWRPDKGTCFWVGKGHNGRAWEMRRRNNYHRNIVKKLRGKVEVRIVRTDLSEREALAAEIELIALYRGQGIKLANITSGGEGVTGHRHSAETRKKLSAASRRRKDYKHSEETKAKIGAANSIALKGRKNSDHSARLKGRKLSVEHRTKISASNTGRIVSPETRAKQRASNVGQRRSAETRERLRIAHLGQKPSAETLRKRTIAIRQYWETADRKLRGEQTRAGFTPEVRAHLSQKKRERDQRART